MYDLATGVIGNMLGFGAAPTAILGGIIGQMTGCGDSLQCALKAGVAYMGVDMLM